MKLNSLLALVALTLCSCRSDTAEIEVYFSPKGGCTEAIVRELQAAKFEVRGQGYSFTSLPIAEAVIADSKRLDVEFLLDKSQRTEHDSQYQNLLANHVRVWIDARHSIAHNKIIVIDRETVLTGSFNFTKAAELHNAENLLVIHDKNLAAKYLKNWTLHKDHSN